MDIKLIKNKIPPGLRSFLERAYHRSRTFSAIPRTIKFEMTTKCNAKCIMCARQDSDIIKEKNIDTGNVTRVIEEYAALGINNITVNLAGLAEPLLYKDIVEVIKLINNKTPKAKVRIITNGIALISELSRKLIQNDLYEISISLNAGSRESYKWLCGVDMYEQVKGNILEFLSIRRSFRKKIPIIDINLKVTDKTRSEIEATINFWKNHLLASDSVTTTEIRTFRENLKASAIDSEYSAGERYPCVQLWNMVEIDIDGNIYPCCGKVLHPNYRQKSELFLGNISKTSIKEIYRGERIKQIRRMHLADDYQELPTCLKCDGYKNLENLRLKNPLSGLAKRKWI